MSLATTKSFIYGLKLLFRRAFDQSDRFTEHHTVYDCMLKSEQYGTSIVFTYCCNPKVTTPNVDNCLESLMLDMSCIDSCSSTDIIEVMQMLHDEFDYKDFAKMKKIATQLVDNYKKMKRFLPNDVTLADLEKYFESDNEDEDDE